MEISLIRNSKGVSIKTGSLLLLEHYLTEKIREEETWYEGTCSVDLERNFLCKIYYQDNQQMLRFYTKLIFSENDTMKDLKNKMKEIDELPTEETVDDYFITIK